MTKTLLVFCFWCISSTAFSQSANPTLVEPNPTPVPQDRSENPTPYTPHESSETPHDGLSENLLQDIIRQTNDYLTQQEKSLLTELEIQELSNIAVGWATPVSASVFLYLLVFSAILGHAVLKKHYKWCAGMVLFGGFATALAWIPPISYTRRHIFPGILSQQLPVVLIQILPTFVWWAALADIGHWFERIGMARGLG